MEELVTPTHGHVLDLASTMAQEDRLEVWDAFHWEPREALEQSLARSADPKAWIIDGSVKCIFGVYKTSPISVVAVPWFLASHDLPKYARRFLRCSKWVVEDWKRQYPRMENYVDARHTRSIRWIEWLGFTLYPPINFGIEQKPFHPFDMVT